MKKINVLDSHFAQLIAAGEVVERPASALKELVENAIDSGATRITVEITHGGIKLIRVIDNGSGIYREDVKNAFLRHATSKIKTEADLEKIGSLGFRGEALASIAAVSTVEVITRTEDENEGTKFVITAGKEEAFESAGATVGTIITVKDLFFNVPARMKFLKKDITEANLCAGVVDKLALSHPEIAFKFIRDGKVTMQTSGDGNISSAIYGVYGRDFFSGLIPVDYIYENVKISGYVSKPEFVKSVRNAQNFFINGRYIKSKLISGALEEAFKNSIMVGRFPCCVLYVAVPFGSVDVNVHPTKTEIKFANEKMIFEAVYYAVKTALMNSENRKVTLTPESFFSSVTASDVCVNNNSKLSTAESSQSFSQKNVFGSKINIPANTQNPYKDKFPETPSNETPVLKPKDEELLTEEKAVTAKEIFDRTKNSPRFEQSIPTENAVQMDMLSQTEKIRVVGEIFNCYIIIEKGSDMILIDKHAAHERIIFEKLRHGKKYYASQNLLKPLVINLEKDEYSAVIENFELLEKSGFKIEDFGSGSIIVRGIPMYLNIEEIQGTIEEISEYLLAHKKSVDTKKLDWIYDNISCRSAVKAGDKTSNEEIISLVRTLSESPDIQHCPHGRPIFVNIGKKFIEKQFGRI